MKILRNIEEDSGNVKKDSGECSRGFRRMFEKVPGNVPEDSGECSRRFRGMFKRIPGNVQEDSGECSRRFRGILSLDLFCEVLLIFIKFGNLIGKKQRNIFCATNYYM